VADHELEIARQRLDVVSGLLRALELRVEIDALIWNASDADEAHRRLTSGPFSFSGAQAHHILDLQLRRRTLADRLRLASEAAELRAVLGE
jgi:DNA gyrase/topoisomerase IV subunit A